MVNHFVITNKNDVIIVIVGYAFKVHFVQFTMDCYTYIAAKK